jgi:hypothetical protein
VSEETAPDISCRRVQVETEQTDWLAADFKKDTALTVRAPQDVAARIHPRGGDDSEAVTPYHGQD